jgi:non-ribosomal peptide synthetase component F
VTLPADRPRPRRLSGRGAQVTFPLLSAAGVGRLAARSRQHEATEFMVLVTAFLALLATRTGQTDVAVGTPVSGRDSPESERLIGFFANTVVLRADLSGEPTFVDALQRVREVTLAAYAHQAVPFETVVAELNPDRRSGHSPLFQVIFSVQDVRGRGLELPGIEAETLQVHNGTAKFDLDLTVVRDEGDVSGVAEFSTDLYDRSTIARLGEEYRAILDTFLHASPVRLESVPGGKA